jgi:hypothetical protein
VPTRELKGLLVGDMLSLDSAPVSSKYPSKLLTNRYTGVALHAVYGEVITLCTQSSQGLPAATPSGTDPGAAPASLAAAPAPCRPGYSSCEGVDSSYTLAQK